MSVQIKFKNTTDVKVQASLLIHSHWLSSEPLPYDWADPFQYLVSSSLQPTIQLQITLYNYKTDHPPPSYGTYFQNAHMNTSQFKHCVCYVQAVTKNHIRRLLMLRLDGLFLSVACMRDAGLWSFKTDNVRDVCFLQTEQGSNVLKKWLLEIHVENQFNATGRTDTLKVVQLKSDHQRSVLQIIMIIWHKY